MNATAIPAFVLKDTYLTVIVNGKPFSLDNTHPTFKQLKEALLKKQWSEVPGLISAAESVRSQTQGAITVENNQVLYKGTVVDNSLTKRIVSLLQEGKPVSHMLKFMENLFKNPNAVAINELYDWLQRNNLPIDDQGCFLAYKRVKKDYKDCHTGTIDNSVGQVVQMPRQEVDSDRMRDCSYGLHFCSREYLSSFSGDRLLVVRINPADVVSIPTTYNFSKGRTWRYEVVKEIENHTSLEEDDPCLRTSVVELGKDRQDLLQKLLADPSIKRAIKKGKIQRSTIVKQTYGRLQKMAAKLPSFYKVAEPSKVLGNTLQSTREARGFSRNAVAKEMGISYKALYRLEKDPEPLQSDMNAALAAMAKLVGVCSRRTTLTFPKTQV